MDFQSSEIGRKIVIHKAKENLNHSSEIPHVDEKWLVSYSDMMTLLFGLFVMLYSMAIEKQGNLNGELKKISVAGFQNKPLVDGTDSPTEKTKNDRTQKALSPEAMVNENETLKKEIDVQNFKIDTLQKAVKDLLEQKENLAEQVQNLRVTLMSTKNEGTMKGWSIVLMAKWENEKHDIDLEVKSPMGVWLNFKNRKGDGETSEFLVDSNHGPGVEIFKTGDEKDGIYEAKVRLYNSRGDLSPSKVELFALTPSGERLIDTVTLTSAMKEKVIIVNKRDWLK